MSDFDAPILEQFEMKIRVNDLDDWAESPFDGAIHYGEKTLNVCNHCGALVLWRHRRRHIEWHRRVETREEHA